MTARLAYYRVSTSDQSVDAQRHALGGGFDHEFSDLGISGAVLASDRPGLSALMSFARRGDTVFIYALDRLGRDSIDVQQTVRDLLNRGIHLHVHGLGIIAQGVGEIVVAVLAQIASMERQRIIERTSAGRTAAKESLARTGKTHRGKTSLGRPFVADSKSVKAWRTKHNATISDTARHFSISTATVTRYCSV
jgi:putative DNA-invertase from lambdoid prophage Rac